MGKTRMEAFFDAVVAIIITIMVLEMKVPHGTPLMREAESAATLAASHGHADIARLLSTKSTKIDEATR